MNKKETAFFAYPGKPEDIAQSIVTAIKNINLLESRFVLETWEKNDISGIPLVEPIFSKISEGKFLAADITFINENVAFEIGYAIGLQKRCILFVNSLQKGDRELANSIGIFDTLGYESYQNSEELKELLINRTDFSPLKLDSKVNHQQPVYIIEPAKRDDPQLMLVSRTKKARWKYRSFNPDEDVRLSAMDAVRHVTQSAGVITPLQNISIQKSREHNIRALFVAGIAIALEIPTLIIHSTEFIPPLDIRDLTKKYRHPNDIAEIIQEFSLEITEFNQRAKSKNGLATSILGGLSIGDPTAENEMTTLSDYYLSTDEYQRASRGEANLVVGRKGSGKTALFVQLRNAKRDRTPKNIVVDLKPEGYQLVKLKERVLDFLTAGAQQHLITALWEYILLLEIAYKLLEKDRLTHMRDHTLLEPYTKLKELYEDTDISLEGDFRERLSKLSDYLIQEFLKRYVSEEMGSSQNNKLNITTNQITELLYQHDIKILFDTLFRYLKMKNEVWLLFDNIDKGWNVEGVSQEDIIILRCLINASRKVEREFKARDISFYSIIFVRDDVYSLLMEGSADYGKDMRVSLDWSDQDLLGEVLKRRLEVSLKKNSSQSDAEIWSRVAVSHYSGEQSLAFLASLSLMRPRNLLKLFRYCMGYAINHSHTKIEADDITHGLKTYAQDLVIEVDHELSDIFPKAKKLIYEFSQENAEFTHNELSTLIQCFGLDESSTEKVINFLLYYGILGVMRISEEPKYIYDVNYDMEMLKVSIRKWGATAIYILNSALWPALNVKPSNHQFKLM